MRASVESHAPLVSVVVANYNGAAYLADAINSARAQTLQDIEIIISDDGSTDESISIAKPLMALDSRIQLLVGEQNSGPAAARNRAIDVARGQWIAILDSDDCMRPERLEKLVTAAVRDGADFVADNLGEFESNDPASHRGLLAGKWSQGPFWIEILDYVRFSLIYGRGPDFGYLKPIFHSSLFKDGLLRYNECLRIGEDFNLVLRLLHAKKKYRVYPEQYYHYRKHGASISHRLNEAALNAILTADIHFSGQIRDDDRPLRAAVIARIRSIDTALAFGRLVSAIKRRAWGDAINIVQTNPKALVLLRLPIGARLRRTYNGFLVRITRSVTRKKTGVAK